MKILYQNVVFITFTVGINHFIEIGTASEKSIE